MGLFFNRVFLEGLGVIFYIGPGLFCFVLAKAVKKKKLNS